MKAFGFAAILISVGMMAACTVTSGDGDTSGDGGSGASGSTTTTSSATTGEGGSGGTGEGGSGTGGAEECSDAGTENECLDCCDETYAEGLEALGIHGFEACGCTADATCASVCDTTDATTDVCNDDGTINLDANNADCVACLNDLAEDDACIEAAAAACEDDAECLPYLECLGTCQ
ncbi:hypothetical protein [Sorangium sp. So ce128]|uniref:hypothetical protein n=1 Tax=Sorangium sp. So ce128 TaxID=3133281 RepID=UPI003F5F688E